MKQSKRRSNDVLIPDEQLVRQPERPTALGRWAKVGIVATGAALGLARLGGVAFAAGPDVATGDRLALDAADWQADDLTLLAGTTAPTIGELALNAGPNDAKSSKGNGQQSSNGNGGSSAKSSNNANNVSSSGSSNGNGGSSAKSSNNPTSMSSAKSSPNGNGVASVKTSQTAANQVSTAQTPPSPTSVSTAQTSVTAQSATTVQSPSVPAATSVEDNGLHLGQLFHQGLTDEQAEDRAALILEEINKGGDSGLTTEDIKAMSLGELLQTAHAAGLSTHDLAGVLEEYQDQVAEQGGE